MNPKNITHAASMPRRERERERESVREREKGRKIKKHKKKAKALYHCSTGEGIIFDQLEAPKRKKKTKKNLS